MKQWVRGVIAAVFVAASLWAQDVPVVVQNTAPLERPQGWVSLVAPRNKCPKPGTVMQVEPQGWPAYVGPDVGARGRLISIKTGYLGPFGYARGLAKSLPPVLETAAVPEAEPRDLLPKIIFETAMGTISWCPPNLQVVETGRARSVILGWGRVPGTMLVCYWWIHVYYGDGQLSQVVPYELFVGQCDPRTEQLVQHVEGIWLETKGDSRAVVDYATARGGGDCSWRCAIRSCGPASGDRSASFRSGSRARP